MVWYWSIFSTIWSKPSMLAMSAAALRDVRPMICIQDAMSHQSNNHDAGVSHHDVIVISKHKKKQVSLTKWWSDVNVWQIIVSNSAGLKHSTLISHHETYILAGKPHMFFYQKKLIHRQSVILHKYDKVKVCAEQFQLHTHALVFRAWSTYVESLCTAFELCFFPWDTLNNASWNSMYCQTLQVIFRIMYPSTTVWSNKICLTMVNLAAVNDRS